MIDASKKELNIIKNIISKYIKNSEIRVFGSRVTGKAKKFSDLDLVIVSKEKLDALTLGLMKDDFEESDLPYRVDILDWNAISPEFKKIIEQKYEVLDSQPP